MSVKCQGLTPAAPAAQELAKSVERTCILGYKTYCLRKKSRRKVGRDTKRPERHFIDLCAGCGGLSLGLLQSGWRGLFAVEKDKLAFATLSFNLLQKKRTQYDWPNWLPKSPLSLQSLLSKYKSQLKKLRGHVDLLAGGPPCQGFSTVGKRLPKDPRNQIFKHYLKLVKLTRPTMVLMENVRGILFPFPKGKSRRGQKTKVLSHAELIKELLEKRLGYNVWYGIVHAMDFGVPQTRPRFILIGVHKSRKGINSDANPLELLKKLRPHFLREKQLKTKPISAKEALSDLMKSKHRLRDSTEMPGFKMGMYGKQTTAYQRLLHGSLNGAVADSHRFVNHRPETVKKFEWVVKNCRKGKIIRPEDRGKFATSKHTLYVLNSSSPAPTVTTLPDDLLHYSEPRILTVREMARLQSFPDRFQFKGKYTTGAKERVKECPRYTQVGNAVPPLLAEALGLTLARFLEKDHVLHQLAD